MSFEIEPIPGQPGLFRYGLGEGITPPPFATSCCGPNLPDREPMPSIEDRLGGIDLLGGSALAAALASAADDSAGMLEYSLVATQQTPVGPTLQSSLRGTRGTYTALRGLGLAEHQIEPVPGTTDTWRVCADVKVKGRGMAGCGCSHRPWDMRGLPGGRMGWLPESTLADLRSRVREIVPALADMIPPSPTDVLLAVWQMMYVEQATWDIGQKLRAFQTAGLLTVADRSAFDARRNALYSLQKGFREPLVAAINRLPGGSSVSALIPQPTMMPGLDQPAGPRPWLPTASELASLASGNYATNPNLNAKVTAVRSSLGVSPSGAIRGLGIFAIDDLTVGGAILLTIVVLGLTAALIYSASLLVDAMTNYTVASAYRDSLASRNQVYNSCISGGGTPEVCARTAATTAPTPSEAGIGGSSGGGGGSTLLIGLGLGLAAWFFLGTEKGRELTSRGAASARAWASR